MKTSSISCKYPTYRDKKLKGCNRWLEGRQEDDNAEGLWRIYDKLYDLTAFIENHPGGSDWLKVTKGIDITEHFETHHITEVAAKILSKFYVRDANQPRNYKITFLENGFYKTLKRRVATKMEFLDRSPAATSKFYCDFVLLMTFLLSIIGTRNENYLIALMAGLSLCCLTTIGHNFIHQRNSWRMYVTNLSLVNFREFRGDFQRIMNELILIEFYSKSISRNFASSLPKLLS
jgi:Cytochrome b5-like Heme/Steroid binding domain